MEHIFRPMRRKDRQLPEEEAWTLLKQENHGVLAITEEDGWPYAVPINYIVLDGCLYLHCSPSAYLIQAIARDDRVCFTVVPRAQLVEDPAARAKLLHAYTFDLGNVSQEIGQRYIEKLGARTALVCIRPEHVTGKANRRYMPVQERLKL